MLAIVGVNGAGKTTLIKLLGGLYQPTAGRITVDGADLASADLGSWRRRLAVVFQDFVHFELPARDNIRLGAPEQPPDANLLAAAARRAEALEFIEQLPAGWDTWLTRSHSGGADLSGGQWQRLALARALYAVAAGRRVLVLDEPTAHLDVQAELAFFRQVLAHVSGTTVILISHRLSTVRQADRIVLLSGGRVVESGAHDGLVDAGGVYADLFALQAAPFQDDGGKGRA